MVVNVNWLDKIFDIVSAVALFFLFLVSIFLIAYGIACGMQLLIETVR